MWKIVEKRPFFRSEMAGFGSIGIRYDPQCKYFANILVSKKPGIPNATTNQPNANLNQPNARRNASGGIWLVGSPSHLVLRLACRFHVFLFFFLCRVPNLNAVSGFIRITLVHSASNNGY